MTAIRNSIRMFDANAQQGTAIVMVMLVLLVLSIIGVYSVSTSSVETKITGVERGLQEAFYTADSGEPIGVSFIKKILQEDIQTMSELGAPWNSVIQDGDNFISELYNDASNRDWDEDIDSKDDNNNLGLSSYVQLLVDVDRLSAQHCAGSGVEFAAGYEGIGFGGGGDVAIFYTVDSKGIYSMRGAESELHAGYRYVPGIVGEEE
jgi:hypothetical protein